jgi:hypothetical protein
MKKLVTLLTVLFCTCLFLSSNAQVKTGDDYFLDTWKVLVKATPQGDVTMVFAIEKKESGFTGVVQDTTGKEISKIDLIEVKDNTITINFKASGYDLSLVMNKKDDDHITGSLINMFNAEGERVKKKI